MTEKSETPDPQAPDSAQAASPGRGGVQTSFADRVKRASEELSSTFGRKLAIAMKNISVPEKHVLSELSATSPIGVKAVVKDAGTESSFMVLAGDAATLSALKLTLGDKAPEAVDDTAMAAFGDFARPLVTAIHGAWSATSGSLAVEVGQPERITALSREFTDEGTTLADVSVAPEEGPEFTLSLILSGAYTVAVSETAREDDDEPLPQVSVAGIERILNITVPLIVEIAKRRVPIREVVRFKPGTVLEFEKKSDDMLDLVVGSARIGKGEAVKVGESFGMRVLEVGSVRQRIKSLSR